MYIMCVCLFSALSHRVGTLQISIIIIIILCLERFHSVYKLGSVLFCLSVLSLCAFVVLLWNWKLHRQSVIVRHAHVSDPASRSGKRLPIFRNDFQEHGKDTKKAEQVDKWREAPVMERLSHALVKVSSSSCKPRCTGTLAVNIQTGIYPQMPSVSHVYA